MHLHDLNGKRVCILGFGREGQSILRALEKHAPGAAITIADCSDAALKELRTTDPPSLQRSYGWASYRLQTGPNYLNDLDSFDIIIKSPGIPPNSKLNAQRSKLTSSTQIFLDTIADTGATVIGITGSKGKSTTTTLIHEMLKAGGRDTVLVGNIGEPAITHIEDAKPGTIFVMEMSSYQLMDLTRSPQIAVITAFFPEHLDYHGSLTAYKEAKSHIARFQKPEDIVYYNALSPDAKDVADESPGRKVPFSPTDAPLPLSATHLLGEHNLGNMAAAFLVATHLDVPRDACLAVLRSFQGLPHRLQSLGVLGGIEWVDDAISTTPESTIAALRALGDRVATIILGGQDRGNDFRALGTAIAASSITNVILFPGSGSRIRRALEEALAHVTFHDAVSMEDAVQIAKKKTLTESPATFPFIVLLSTASPSYGMLKNFDEKGAHFQRCIEQEYPLH